MGSIDWQINKAPLECTKFLLENEVYSDVTFSVGEGAVKMKSHRLILSMRSPVFDRMFNGSFRESIKDPVIPDVTPTAFQAMLRYCYYECLDIEDDVALSVLYASTKYMLPVLEKAARKKLNQTLGARNVWDIYKYAVTVRDTELHNACMVYLQGDITPVREALLTQAFLDITHKVLLEFLHINDKADKRVESRHKYVPYQNNVGISISEIELFNACNSWAEVECLHQGIDPTGANKRAALGECLSLIRFPTMNFKDLVTTVYPTGILTQTEKDNLSLYKHSDPGSQCTVDFPTRERQFLVTTPRPSKIARTEGTVYIDSDVRLTLSRILVLIPGSYKVTVKDEASGGSWTMMYETNHHTDQCTKFIKTMRHLVYSLELKPQQLEGGTRYSITTLQANRFDSPDVSHVIKWEELVDLSPFNEIRVTWDSEIDNCIFALGLCLV